MAGFGQKGLSPNKNPSFSFTSATQISGGSFTTPQGFRPAGSSSFQFPQFQQPKSSNPPKHTTDNMKKETTFPSESQQKQIQQQSQFIISDEVCKRTRVASQWVSINELCVFPTRNPTNIEGTSDLAPCQANVHFLKEINILNDPELRKLVNESQAIFFASRNSSSDDSPKFRALGRSREHRSSIRVCMENMHQAMKKNPKNNYESWITVLGNIELIWHLCELLYLEVIHSDIVLPKLLEWSRLNSEEYDDNLSRELHMGKGADLRNGEKYWRQVMGLLVEARFEATRALLRLHSEADTKLFLEADILLRGIPIYTVKCGLSPVEFNARWRAWKTNVRSKISAGAFVSSPQLLKLMNILGSVDPIFSLLKDHCNTWYHMLTAVVQFTDPMVRTHDLVFHAKKCIEQYGGEGNLKLLDHTLLALLCGNLSSAIAKLLMCADNGWSAVHLCNLLHVSGCLNKNPETSVKCEPLLLKYGLMLMSHKRFWQIGLSYLKFCPNDGKEAIAVQLSSMLLTDDKTVLKILQAAIDNGLHDVVNSVCRTYGMHHVKEGNLGNALTWALMSKDVDLMSLIADRYLYKYSTGSSEKELNCYSILSGLGQSVFISSRLTFLCKYCEFQKCYLKGDAKEAAAIIIRLIDSKISPKYFWLTLLWDALPILEMKGKPVFSNDDCIVLLACLEELANGWIDNPAKKSQNDQIKIIRLAITKNLARTLLQSNVSTRSNVITVIT